MINPVSDFLCVHQDAEKFKSEIMGMMNITPDKSKSSEKSTNGDRSGKAFNQEDFIKAYKGISR
jgi:hypothetical protein